MTDDKGITGLMNLGNTCFINSTLQCLSHTPELHDILSNTQVINENIESILMKEWIELRNLMWSQNCTISPKKFLMTLQNTARTKNKDVFTGYAQNDLPEFILFLMECFQNAIKRDVEMNISGMMKNKTDEVAKSAYTTMKLMYEKDYSEIISTFFGIHVSEIRCPKTNDLIHFITEPYFMVDLPIPKKHNPSLIDCFDLYTSIEHLDGENMWYNEKTKEKQKVNRKISFFSLPSILIIDLKRFENTLRKNNTKIDFPFEDLDLSSYINGYHKDKFKYDLYGICNHMGSTQGGHYTSMIRSQSNTWYHFNDNQISIIKDISMICKENVYCLFYRKKDIMK